MYFLFFILQGWGKRSAVQPKPTCSELPYKEKGLQKQPNFPIFFCSWSDGRNTA